MRYLPALDGLRAIAVLAVVAYHAGLGGAGYVGVDIFFVISGYLITGLLAREYAETGRIDLPAFYARRVRRILPAMLVVVGVTLAVGAAMLPAAAQQHLARSAVAGLAVVANLFFQSQTGGYFDAAADEMPLLHLWSLSVEEQFYFLWPLLLWGLLRWRKAPAMVALLAASSLLLVQQLTQESAFYQMPARFWELAVGGLIALRPANGRPIVAYAGLALLAFAVTTPVAPFPGVGALPAVIGAGLVIHALHGGADVPLLRWRPMVFVGLISYSLYLWHWPLLALARATRLGPLPAPTALALCALAGALAWLSYRFVETPFRRNRKVLLPTLSASLALLLCAGFAPIPDDLASRTKRDFAADKVQCHPALKDPVMPDGCGAGPVFLWGDSHAFMWRSFAERYGKVRSMTRGNCPPSIGNPKGGPCAQSNALALEHAKRASVVVLGAYWLRVDDGVRRNLREVVVALAPRRIVIMGPVPELPHTAPRCISLDLDCAIPRDEFDRQASETRAFLASLPNVEVVDPVDFFCNATECPVLKDGYSLYWDEDHISGTAARRFMPVASPAS